jgi:hypothetical protein
LVCRNYAQRPCYCFPINYKLHDPSGSNHFLPGADAYQQFTFSDYLCEARRSYPSAIQGLIRISEVGNLLDWGFEGGGSFLIKKNSGEV